LVSVLTAAELEAVAALQKTVRALGAGGLAVKSTTLDWLGDLADRLNVELRYVPMDGAGGGLCRIRGQQVLFVDTLADPEVRFERTIEAMAELPEIDQVYVRPDVREHIERVRRQSAGG
jgi:hypothetical protein